MIVRLYRWLRRKRLTVLVLLPQDLSVLMPVARFLHKRGRLSVSVYVTRQSLIHYPDLRRRIEDAGLRCRVTDEWLLRIGAFPFAPLPTTVLCASESSTLPHRVAHRFVAIARAFRRGTVTLQHGIENVGLAREALADDGVSFASKLVLAWTAVPDEIALRHRSNGTRVVVTGRPTSLDTKRAASRSEAGNARVLVAENLHWDRYSEAYRAFFLACISRLAELPDVAEVVLKPHPAGRWVSRNADLLPRHDKIRMWRDTPDGEARADTLESGWFAVVTTPSTIALDAALLGYPVFLCAYDMDLAPYEPLPMIRDVEAVAEVTDRESLPKRDVDFFIFGCTDTRDGTKLTSLVIEKFALERVIPNQD